MSDAVVIVAVPLVSAGIAAVAAIITSRRTSRGSLEQIVNDRMKLILEDADLRNHECEEKVARLERSIEAIRGQLREALQFSASLISVLRRNKIMIPRGAEASLQKLLERQDAALTQAVKEQTNA